MFRADGVAKRHSLDGCSDQVVAICLMLFLEGRDNLRIMSKLLRGLAAGYGAKKLGGGCFTTILIFIALWWGLGHFEIFR